MMNRFLSDTEVMRIPLPNEFQEEFTGLMDSYHRNPVGTLGHDSSPISGPVKIEFPHNFTRSVFNLSEINSVKDLFIDLHSPSSIDINWTFRKYHSATVNGKVTRVVQKIQVLYLLILMTQPVQQELIILLKSPLY